MAYMEKIILEHENTNNVGLDWISISENEYVIILLIMNN